MGSVGGKKYYQIDAIKTELSKYYWVNVVHNVLSSLFCKVKIMIINDLTIMIIVMLL